MNPWSIIETVVDIAFSLSNWRFSVCIFVGIALAFAVASSISVEPLRWILAVAVVIVGIVIGWRWDKGH
jgi:uncharacterized membrane protein YfcA